MLVSADMVRLAEVMGVAAVLSTKASESVVSTAMAIPAPEPVPVESALDEMFVLTLEVIETLPVAVMAPVPESWLLALASTWATVTEESLALASFQFVVSDAGLFVLVTSMSAA